MARKHNQYAVAKECSIAQGKYLAMFTDNANVTDTVWRAEMAKMDADEEAELRRIANIRIREMSGIESNQRGA